MYVEMLTEKYWTRRDVASDKSLSLSCFVEFKWCSVLTETSLLLPLLEKLLETNLRTPLWGGGAEGTLYQSTRLQEVDLSKIFDHIYNTNLLNRLVNKLDAWISMHVRHLGGTIILSITKQFANLLLIQLEIP